MSEEGRGHSAPRQVAGWVSVPEPGSAGEEFCVLLVSTLSRLMLLSLPVQGESKSGYVTLGLGPGASDSQGSIG
eukprot:1803276-Rhodomonas_salina.1